MPGSEGSEDDLTVVREGISAGVVAERGREFTSHVGVERTI